MRLNPRVWWPIAAIVSLVNIPAVWAAAWEAEPWHATVHAALALVFGIWAGRLLRRARPTTPP